MRFQKNILASLMLMLSVALYSCGNSKVGGANNSDVGFDPSKTSSLQVMHFDAIKESLLVNFQLSSGSNSVSMLNSKQSIFDKAIRDYTSLFATNFTLIMAEACHEMDATASLFPDGPVIDTAWKKLTGRAAGAESAAIQSAVLAKVSSQPDDVKIFALCLAVALSPEATFINFVPGA